MKFDAVLEPIEVQKETKDVKLAVIVCSSRDIKPQTNMCLVNLVGYLIHQGKDINLTRLDLMGGVAESLLSAARQRKLSAAMQGDYTHVAMFDDDMIFPYDAVHKMLVRDKDVVFANVCQKVPDKINGVCLDLQEGKRIDSSGKEGLEEVSHGTLACTLIKLDAMRNIPAPHYEVLWVPELNGGQGGYQGEDHYFFRKMKQAGIKFYCDHDITRSVQHVGDYPYQFKF